MSLKLGYMKHFIYWYLAILQYQQLKQCFVTANLQSVLRGKVRYLWNVKERKIMGASKYADIK